MWAGILWRSDETAGQIAIVIPPDEPRDIFNTLERTTRQPTAPTLHAEPLVSHSPKELGSLPMSGTIPARPHDPPCGRWRG